MSAKGGIVRAEKRCFICGEKILDSPYENDNYDSTANTSITYVWHGLCRKCKNGENHAVS